MTPGYLGLCLLTWTVGEDRRGTCLVVSVLWSVTRKKCWKMGHSKKDFQGGRVANKGPGELGCELSQNLVLVWVWVGELPEPP